MAKFDPIAGRYVYVECHGVTHRTYYEQSGDSGIPLVCLHTAGSDGRQWRHLLCDSDITRDYRVIAFDLPRHGKSNPPAEFFKEEEEYKMTGKFYCDFIVAFCHALELDKPVVIGSSMGGNVCLPLALYHDGEFRALIGLQGHDYTPGWNTDILHHPHIHPENYASFCYGLMAPQSPEENRWETWWHYAQGGPGVFKGDLYFYSVDHDFRELTHKISGNTPLFFLTGEYDYICTPQLAEKTTLKVKNAEHITMHDIGHFPMSEAPEAFKKYLMPVLGKIKNIGR